MPRYDRVLALILGKVPPLPARPGETDSDIDPYRGTLHVSGTPFGTKRPHIVSTSSRRALPSAELSAVSGV
jgi:hypothetical protein